MILSWDIGIKNLSYCILSIEDNQHNRIKINKKKTVKLNDKSFTIHNWDVINLVEALENYKKLSYKDTNNDNNDINDYNNKSCNLIRNFSQRNKIICNLEKCKKVARYCYNENHNKGYCANHFNKLNEREKKDYFYIGDKVPKCLYENCTSKSTFILETHHYKTYCTIHQKKLIKNCPNIKT